MEKGERGGMEKRERNGEGLRKERWIKIVRGGRK